MTLRKNGMFLMLVSNFFFAMIPITVKWAGQLRYSPTETTFFRFAFATLGILALAVLGWQKLKIVNFKVLFWRGFFGGVSVLFYFMTVYWTTAAKGTLLNYTYSIWANVFAVLFFRHKPPKGFVPLLLTAIAGVWLVLDIQIGAFNWGDWTGILSGATAGAAVVAIKEARRTDNALTIFASFTFFGLLISGLLLGAGPCLGPAASLAQWIIPHGMGWVVLLGMGACSMAAQLLFTEGYGYTSLAMGTLLSLIVPVLTALFGLVLLGEPLTPHFLLGTLLVLASCALFGLQEKGA